MGSNSHILKTGKPGLTTARLFRGDRLRVLVCCAILAACTTGIVAYLLQRNLAHDIERTNALKERLAVELQRRVAIYAYGLAGTRSAITAVEQPSQDLFRRMMASRDLPQEFPAAIGIAYITNVPDEQLDQFITDRQAEQQPNFRYWTQREDERTHNYRMIVTYSEPRQTHSALGYDISSDPRRHAAAKEATRTGQAVITQAIDLVTPDFKGTGFLLILPCYQTPETPPTQTLRLASVKGWVVMPLLAQRVFHQANTIVDGELEFDVYDAPSPQLGQLVFTHNTDPAAADFQADRQQDTITTTVDIGGREWAVVMYRTNRFQSTSNAAAWLVGSTGSLATLLLAITLLGQQHTTNKARNLAEEMTAEHRRQALTDRLTGLPNRTAITERIQEAIHRAQRVPGYDFAVMFIDFDRFKLINDSMGHDTGDTLLQSISHRLKTALRAHDITSRFSPSDRGYNNFAARLGGDEFIVLLDGIDRPESIFPIADRLLNILKEPHVVNESSIVSTASIGIAVNEEQYTDANQLIRDADTAMYEAKSTGKNTVVMFNPHMRDRVNHQVNIETDLNHALRTGEQLRLVYQPIVDLRTQNVERFEALIRWNHPQHGPVSPADFIDIAEESHLIVDLDNWVIQQAIQQIAQWQTQGLDINQFSLSVNLSRRSILSDGLVKNIVDLLNAHNIQPQQLHLEVTERGVMRDPAKARQILQMFHEQGIAISLDDFGADMSSLACLDQLPISTLKLDRSFVAGFVDDPKRIRLLRAVAEFGNQLDLHVIAEGVEHHREVQHLQALGCDMAQGYYFSRPLEAQDIPNALTLNNHPRLAA